MADLEALVFLVHFGLDPLGVPLLLLEIRLLFCLLNLVESITLLCEVQISGRLQYVVLN